MQEVPYMLSKEVERISVRVSQGTSVVQMDSIVQDLALQLPLESLTCWLWNMQIN
ncbi:hypothetical protein Taro_030370 [Colocasia esculenta]|uniref:Uncharacterized protein n=1 Tax=Colocasia esculenta TaxID=4460 RepID=A0A843VTW2_COLES|nr:hypothetical protein [Colocasia esculenta]